MEMAMMELRRIVAGKVCAARSLSSTPDYGGLLRRRASSSTSPIARRFGPGGTTCSVSPTPAAARHYYVSGSSPEAEKHRSMLWKAALIPMSIYSILKWIDYNGEWAQQQEERRKFREEYLKELRELKREREELEAELKGEA